MARLRPCSVATVATGCGVTRGDDPSGLHRLRMMVPNSPGGGYDLTARTAVKIMEDDDITGRVEVFNVIGAGGTVAMARLMNEARQQRPHDDHGSRRRRRHLHQRVEHQGVRRDRALRS